MGRVVSNLIQVKINQEQESRPPINCTCWNARSVKNKTVCLYDFLSSRSCDLIFLTETWLHNTIDSQEDDNQVTLASIIPDSYKIKHIPRHDGREGGGVAIIYTKEISVDWKGIKLNTKFKQFESVSILVYLKEAPLFVSVVYRPDPTKRNGLKLKSYWKEWSEFLSYHALKKTEFIITGDVNFHLNKPENASAKKFHSSLKEFGLKQHVEEPTHIAGNTLDILITRSNSNLITELSVVDPGFVNDNGQPVNDHLMIKWKMKGSKKVQQLKTVNYRRWRHVDTALFQEDLAKQLEQLSDMTSYDLNHLAKWYKMQLEELADKHAPIVTKKVNDDHNPWYNNEIREMKREQRQHERKYLRTKLFADHQIFRNFSHQFNRKIKQAKQDYLSSKITECNQDYKKIYSITNSLMGKKIQNSFPKSTSDQALADSFIDYFSDKVKIIHHELENEYHQLPKNRHPNLIEEDHCFPSLTSFTPATEEEVQKITMKLSNKQCILDPVPTYFLKKILPSLLSFITHIVNRSLAQGYMPDCLKTALIRPVIKKNDLDHELFESYRPVSNLPILGKIIEGVVASRLTYHISTNKLFDTNQSAYRKFHSTETALVKMHNDILQKLDQNQIVALIMIDVSAAFDTVPHQRLIDRFSHDFNVTGTALKWLTSYLENRYQKVIVNSSQSKVVEMKCGFPQGAKLAGIKYNVYSTPLGKVVTSYNEVSHQAYADDNGAYIAFSVEKGDLAITQLEKCINDVKMWMGENYLKMNDDKTQIIYFQPRHDRVFEKNVRIGEFEIKPSSCIKNLGVKMDQMLTSENQVNQTTKSAYFHLRNISKVRKYLDIPTTKTLVQNLVISRIDYCNSLFANLPLRLINKIQKVQNAAARVITKTKMRCHITPVLKELHWLPVRSRIQFKILLLTFKCLHEQAPEYLKKLIIEYTPSRTLRSNNALLGTLIQPRYRRRKHGGRTFTNVSAELWNETPAYVRNSETVSQFKKQLKTVLFNAHYNSSDNL